MLLIIITEKRGVARCLSHRFQARLDSSCRIFGGVKLNGAAQQVLRGGD